MYNTMIQEINISVDLLRQPLDELGRKPPYIREVEFPMNTKKYKFWGIQVPPEDSRYGTQYEVWWLSDSEHNSWQSFFDSNPYRLPLADAKRAYQAIGYKAIQLEFTVDDSQKNGE